MLAGVGLASLVSAYAASFPRGGRVVDSPWHAWRACVHGRGLDVVIGHDLRTTLPDPARTRFAVWLGSQWRWKQGNSVLLSAPSPTVLRKSLCAHRPSVRSVGSDIACISLSMARQCQMGDDCRFSVEYRTLVACLAG